MTHNKVIVFGCGHGGLATIRALGKRGIPVIAVTHDSHEFGLSSKYIDETVIGPPPSDTSALLEFLLKRSEEWRGALLLENTDQYAVALATHKQQLSEFYRIITPDLDITRIFIDKDKTYEIADQAGVPHPAIFHVRQPEDIEKAIAAMSLPLIIKPVRSHEFFQKFNKKMFIAESVDELHRILTDVQKANLEVVLQEIIPGDDTGTLESVSIYIDKAGDIRTEVFNVKLRQIPPMWGVMRVGKTVPPIADVQEHARNLLRAADFRGFADIEFKRDPRDGLPKLIEANIRLSQNLQLTVASGVDVPWMIYQDYVEDTIETATDYQSTYYIDLIHDLGYSLVREPRKTFMSFLTFVKPYLSRHKTFAVWALTDPKPFLKQVRNKLAR